MDTGLGLGLSLVCFPGPLLPEVTARARPSCLAGLGVSLLAPGAKQIFVKRGFDK